MRPRQLVAFSGLLPGPGDTGSSFDLVEHALSLAECGPRPRVCYVPTAVGDSAEAISAKGEAFGERRPEVDISVLTLFPQPSVPDVRGHLLASDLVLVEGGSVVNLLALWRAHGVDQAMREAWMSGVVLAGASAGSLCWHTGGVTDSYGDDLAPFSDGLGLVPFSNGVHDDLADQPRRQVYRALVGAGSVDPGFATEDGVGLHYLGSTLHEAVTIRPGASAWWVEPDGSGGHREERLPARAL